MNNRKEISNFADILWVLLLTVAGLGGSLVISCVTPFAALAVALAGTLRLRGALLAMTALWLANQFVGFAFLGFPRTANTMFWGLAIGIAAWVSTVAAAGVLRRTTVPRLALALAASFAVYEVSLFLAAAFLGGVETFSPAIIIQIGLVNLAWLVGLVALNEVAVLLLRTTPRLREA